MNFWGFVISNGCGRQGDDVGALENEAAVLEDEVAVVVIILQWSWKSWGRNHGVLGDAKSSGSLSGGRSDRLLPGRRGGGGEQACRQGSVRLDWHRLALLKSFGSRLHFLGVMMALRTL